jgi:hypothetical protein
MQENTQSIHVVASAVQDNDIDRESPAVKPICALFIALPPDATMHVRLSKLAH